MKFRVEPKCDYGRFVHDYWAIGYDVPVLKEVARTDTKERAEEIARLLTDTSVASYFANTSAPVPTPPDTKWWEIWK